MRKAVATMLLSVTAFANVLAMNPATVVAKQPVKVCCEVKKEKKAKPVKPAKKVKCKKCKKEKHKYVSADKNKKCDICGKKKAKHCHNKHH